MAKPVSPEVARLLSLHRKALRDSLRYTCFNLLLLGGVASVIFIGMIIAGLR